MDRTILHCDLNGFYASVECIRDPSLRTVPMAVAGDPKARHGIILAKNELAKRAGVVTAETVSQAQRKCPGLVLVPPRHDVYEDYSRKVNALYERYTDLIEPFGIDESWLDVTGSRHLFGDGRAIADALREAVKRELDLTISVGVSYNKVFAKLGSDYKKPDAVTVISRENYQKIAWPLPVSDLIYVGPRTASKLSKYGIYTIGDLARADSSVLEYKLGKNGIMLKAFAMGLDRSPVKPVDADEVVKSVGNSTTPPHDITTPEEAKAILYLLVESVGERLRALGFRSRQVTVTARGTDLLSSTRQATLNTATDSTARLARAARAIFDAHFAQALPLRSMGVSCGRLVAHDVPAQMDMLGDAEKMLREEQLDRALDSLRYRYGHTVIRRGIVLADEDFARIDPAGQVIHPVAFLQEGGVKYDNP